MVVGLVVVARGVVVDVPVAPNRRQLQIGQPCASISKPFGQAIIHVNGEHLRALIVAINAKKTRKIIPIDCMIFDVF